MPPAVPEPPRIDPASAFVTLERALEDHQDRDLREDREVIEAIEYLKSRSYRPYPVEQFRKALDIQHPWERYEAASQALRLIRRQHWYI